MSSSGRPDLPLLARILRAFHYTKIRGRTRLALILARRMKTLQAVPIAIADWPPLYVDLRLPNSHFWLLGTPFERSPVEVDEQIVMRRFVRPGDVIYDIGANLGLHTMLLSRLTGPQGRVCSFEPNAALHPTLSLTAKGLGNTTLYPFALSDQHTESIFFVPDDHSMGSLADWTSADDLPDIRRTRGLGRAKTTTARQRRMDDLVNAGTLPAPDFIKCDVEGAELLVCKGGRQTLDRRAAPMILFEARPDTARGFGLRPADAADFLASLPHPGYEFLRVRDKGTLEHVRPADLNGRIQNVLAVPQSQWGRCPELCASAS